MPPKFWELYYQLSGSSSSFSYSVFIPCIVTYMFSFNKLPTRVRVASVVGLITGVDTGTFFRIKESTDAAQM